MAGHNKSARKRPAGSEAISNSTQDHFAELR